MAQTAEGGTAPCPHRAIGCQGGHVTVAYCAVDDGLTLEGILDLAGKHLVGTVFRIPLTQLVAVTLSERPQAASLRNDGSGYTQLKEERILFAPAVT